MTLDDGTAPGVMNPGLLGVDDIVRCCCALTAVKEVGVVTAAVFANVVAFVIIMASIAFMAACRSASFDEPR